MVSIVFEQQNLSWLDWLVVFFIFVMFASSYVITNMLFHPIWYVFKRNAKRLCEKPPYLDDCWRIDAKNAGLTDPFRELGLQYEEVEFLCGPNIHTGNRILRGWLIPNANRDLKLCVVVCHGGGRDRRQHLRHVPALHDSGAAVLLFDKQEHGLSDGNTRGVAWFSTEGSDVYAACRFMKLLRRYERVVAMGTSFGGAGVLTACGYFDKQAGEEQMIDGVIAENPPHSRLRFIKDLIYQNAKNYYYLPSLLCELLSFFTCLMLFCRRGHIFMPNPVDVIKNISPRPLLITHGEADSVVPVTHGKDLYDAALEPKECLWVPNCDHTMVINVDPTGWRRKTMKLLKQVMEKEGGKPVLVEACVGVNASKTILST